MGIIWGLGFAIMYTILQARNRDLPENKKVKIWSALAMSVAFPFTVAYLIGKHSGFDGLLKQAFGYLNKDA